MTPLLFLDIDGVLNSESWMRRRPNIFSVGTHINNLDPEACLRLQQVCSQTQAHIVIMSSWRLYSKVYKIKLMLAERGVNVPIHDTATPDFGRYNLHFHPQEWSKIGRGLEVQAWLQDHLSPEKLALTPIACLDDGADFGGSQALNPVLVQTNWETGLLDHHIPLLQAHLRIPLGLSRACGGHGQVVFPNSVTHLSRV